MKRLEPNKKVILGITGSFGSGKSTVAGIFKSFGAKIIDADSISRKITRPKAPAYKKIVRLFGRGILQRSGVIDRKRLAGVVFNNPVALSSLTRIIHPEVIRSIRREIRDSAQSFIILDVPLLIEAGLQNAVDKLIVVSSSQRKQIERVRRKTGLKKLDILKRIAAQIPLKEKVRLADFVIDNDGSMNKTRKQVTEIRRQLWRS